MNKIIKLFLIVVGIPVVLIVALFLYVWVESQVNTLRHPKSTDPVIGNLGGMPVAIPRVFARFVEYDKDPHFMKRSGWLVPERTYESKLRGFAFEVRYPDMASTKVQTEAEKDIYTTTWMRALIFSGEHYGTTGDEGLDNRRNGYLNPDFPCYSHCFIYVPLSGKTHGLTGYTPTGSGVDVEKRSVNFGRGTDLRDRNIYFAENEVGEIITFIECSNRTHAAATCTQYFNLKPVLKVRVSVTYRKALLPHWQQIQQSLTELIYSFEAKTATSTQTQTQTQTQTKQRN